MAKPNRVPVRPGDWAHNLCPRVPAALPEPPGITGQEQIATLAFLIPCSRPLLAWFLGLAEG